MLISPSPSESKDSITAKSIALFDRSVPYALKDGGPVWHVLHVSSLDRCAISCVEIVLNIAIS